MNALSLRRFNEASLLVHASDSLEAFSLNVLRALRVVLDADICLVNWTDPRLDGARTLYDPVEAVPGAVNDGIHAFLHQHPGFPRRASAASISDMASRRAWHRTVLYAEGYGRAAQEDDLGIDLRVGGARLLTLAATRSRRGFDADEHSRLDLLAQHVRVAHQRLWAGAARLGEIVVDEQGRLRQATGEMERLLALYFRPWQGGLPETPSRWLAASVAARKGAGAQLAPAPLRVREGHRELTLTHSPALVAGHPGWQALFVGEAWQAPVAGGALSAREQEVLELVSDGLSNRRIAAVLALSPGTVKRHLENIYAKLEVPNRQAAARWAHARRHGGRERGRGA